MNVVAPEWFREGSWVACCSPALLPRHLLALLPGHRVALLPLHRHTLLPVCFCSNNTASVEVDKIRNIQKELSHPLHIIKPWDLVAYLLLDLLGHVDADLSGHSDALLPRHLARDLRALLVLHLTQCGYDGYTARPWLTWRGTWLQLCFSTRRSTCTQILFQMWYSCDALHRAEAHLSALLLLDLPGHLAALLALHLAGHVLALLALLLPRDVLALLGLHLPGHVAALLPGDLPRHVPALLPRHHAGHVPALGPLHLLAHLLGHLSRLLESEGEHQCRLVIPGAAAEQLTVNCVYDLFITWRGMSLQTSFSTCFGTWRGTSWHSCTGTCCT